MKSTGIVRKLDELGRVVIPIELRNQFHIVEKDAIEIFVDGSSIVLRKFEEHCIFCNTTEELIKFNGKLICKNCINKISKTIE